MGMEAPLNKDKVPSLKFFFILIQVFSQDMNMASYSCLEVQHLFFVHCTKFLCFYQEVNMNLVSSQVLLNTNNY